MYPDIAFDGMGWIPASSSSAVINQTVPEIQPPPQPNPVLNTPPPLGQANLLFLDTVNIREGPGHQYKSLGVASYGTSALAVGKSTDGLWFAISVPASVSDLGIGWVKGEYVQVVNPSELPVLKP
jgi:hypothetical protein